MKKLAPKSFRRAMAFVKSNGGWRSTCEIAWRKIRRCGPTDAIRAVISHASPVPLWPQWRYRRYIKLVESVPTAEELAKRTASLSGQPGFLILLRFGKSGQANTQLNALHQSVDSVRNQAYRDWCLRVIGAAKVKISRPKGDQDVAFITARDSSDTEWTRLANAACAESDADFVILMQAGDLMRPHSLLYVAERAIARPESDFIYTDSDSLNSRGRRTEPHFKPQWSPDTLLSWHYTGNLSAYRRSLVVGVGGLRPDLTDAMEYDLALRVSEHAKKIERVPGILFHRCDFSNASTRNWEAASQAQRAALKRRGIDAEVECVLFKKPRKPSVGGNDVSIDAVGANPAPHSRIRYTVQGDPLVSIIIPTRDHVADVRKCLDSLYRVPGGARREIILIDNGSTDPESLSVFEQWQEERRIRLLRLDVPFNFSVLNNRAVEVAQGDFLLFLNNDTEVIGPEDWLERMVGTVQQEWVGAVGARLLYPNGTIQHIGVSKVGDGPTHVFSGFPPDYSHPRCQFAGNWSAVTAACMMVEKSKFLSVRGFDESLAVTFNDVDLCFRFLDAGLFNQVLPEVTLLHHEFRTRGNDRLEEEKRERLFAALDTLYTRWPQYRDDPCYNPNLSTSFADFMPRN